LERDKGTRRIIRLCKAGEKTAVTSATPGAKDTTEDDEDVPGDVPPNFTIR
jgi:hypothetical protein